MSDDAVPGEGRVVLVTGGTRGIGWASAQWFLDHGDRVAVTSRSGAVEGDVGPGAGPGADRLLSLACDVTDPDQVGAAFDTIEETWGP
ncbi:MAG: SDR family oxidoreductase, partial [Acidimicrobiales bacterium]